MAATRSSPPFVNLLKVEMVHIIPAGRQRDRMAERGTPDAAYFLAHFIRQPEKERAGDLVPFEQRLVDQCSAGGSVERGPDAVG